jgi:hypothetical protein
LSKITSKIPLLLLVPINYKMLGVGLYKSTVMLLRLVNPKGLPLYHRAKIRNPDR